MFKEGLLKGKRILINGGGSSLSRSGWRMISPYR